jgi:hypothetical protein
MMLRWISEVPGRRQGCVGDATVGTEHLLTVEDEVWMQLMAGLNTERFILGRHHPRHRPASLGQAVLERLPGADRAPELLALLDVGEGVVVVHQPPLRSPAADLLG